MSTDTDPGTAIDDAPRWDVSDLFPSLSSREFLDASERFGADVARLVALYDQHGVRGGASDLDGAAVDEVLRTTNDVHEQLTRVSGFISAFVTTDAADAEAQAAMSRLDQAALPLSSLRGRLDAWLDALGVDAVLAASEEAAAHEWPVRKSAMRAERLLTEEEESLAAELDLTGASAWARLYSDVTSGITCEVDLPGGTTSLPVFAVRGLAADEDRAVRAAAHRAELAAWEAHQVPIVAALNAIKGQQQTLVLRRGWSSVLEAQLFGQAVERSTLDAMQRAVVDSFPAFRSYFRAKATLLGLDQLAFWDLFAPVGRTQERSWDDAVRSVEEAFASYSPQLRALARRAVDQRWIDVAPRAGKRGGAFCMPVGEGDSRILMNFNGSVDGIMTLAHELGHAYHNTTMSGRTPMQRATPSSLAETASIFCETVMVAHGLATAGDDDERLAILEVHLQGAAQVVVDIHSRFLFESAVFERRRASTLSAAECCELMDEAQEATYGDGLDPAARHSWMWAAKPHYYGSMFYNWPYTFGLLFGIGLYAQFQQDPDRFRTGYDDLLSSTGLGQAGELAARFGIDVSDEAFWRSSLAVLTDQIDQFAAMVDERAGSGGVSPAGG